MATPRAGPSRTPSQPAPLELPRYELGAEVATRKAYGDALAALGAADGLVVALDGEVSNSTYAEIFKEAHPERFFEMFIAEQQMVAAAVGLQVRRLEAVRLHLRGLPHARLRLHPHGRHQPGEHRAFAARTRASPSARTARRRWRSRTSR